MAKLIDLTGRRFHKLLVLRRYEGPCKRVSWVCLCDCGNIVIVSGANLISGNTKSCGCGKHEQKLRSNIEGKHYGWLTVIKRIDSKYVLCKCICGKEVVVQYSNLISGNTKSCGCATARFLLENTKAPNLVGKIFGELLVIAKYIEENSSKHEGLWICLCSCGRYTIVSTQKLTTGHTQSCGCMKNSFAESIIVRHLKEQNISHSKEHKYKDLLSKSGYPLRFDFKIDTVDGYFLLEYQGVQHFEDHDFFGKEQREETDILKRNYCKIKNICLEEIRYDEDIIPSLNAILQNIMCYMTIPCQANRNLFEGVTTIPTGSRFTAKFRIPKCHAT